MSNEIKCVVFDIDGTIIDGSSWLAVTEAVGSSTEEHRQIYQARRVGTLDEPAAKARILKLWRKNGVLSRGHLQSIYKNLPLREGTVDVLSYLKGRGYLICFITGSTDLLAEVIANRLGVKCFFANAKLIWDKDGILVDYEYRVDQGEVKLDQLKKLVITENLVAGECAAVGDGINDVEIFEYTGHGIALQPVGEELVDIGGFQKLRDISWKEIKNLEELKNIL